ncbi:hypothetical protein [Stenotrophomonas sp. YAU14D1_LEIMI4_1]|uniref:hypothetical protein n=1 Tax=Stenotrophomonas sp. YAU14D1_LEIMI4_1 TaxID=2072407 RepID=UPI00131EDF3D|nr:hypothetical protein [Stenotrophomonas sp. YAU14D1_LEIMI4_1]
MQARKLTLVEIGVGALPSPTPPAPRFSNWFPVAYRAPDVPPVEGVTPTPVADGVLLEWPAVDQAGVIYVIERGPAQDGPWTEIYRTTETRYVYSDASGTQWWFRITPTVRGKPGGGTVVVATPTPATADLIEQQLRLSKEISDRIEADALEAAARADGLAAAARDLLAEAVLREQDVADAMGAIAQEAQDRAYAVLNERLEREAAISLEAETRQSDMESLSRALSEVVAGSGTQFDSRKIWYFDTAAENWIGNGADPTVMDGWLRPANAADSPWVQSPPALEIDGSAYRFAKLRVKRVGTPAWNGTLQWITADDQAWDDEKRVPVPEPLWDDHGVATVDVADIAWWPGEIDAIRLQFGDEQAVANYFLLDWVAIGRPTPGAGVALVQDEARARVAADSAEASRRETLAAQLRGDYDGTDISQVATGLFAVERDARVSADEASASAIEVLQARMPVGDGLLATEASVTEESQARADGDSANAEAIQLVQARMPEGEGAVASGAALESVSARVEETEEGLRAVGERVTSVTAQLEGQHAGDEDSFAGDEDVYAGTRTVLSAIAEGDLAQAQSVTRLDAELGQFKALATQQIEAVATDVSVQAQRVDAVQVELEGKASAEAVSQLRASVEQNADGIVAVSESLQGVKVELGEKASAQVVQGMEARVQETEGGLAQVMAKAFLHLIADSGAGPLIGGMELGNDGNVVSLRFLTNSMEIVAPNGAAEGMEWRSGYLRVWKGAAQRIIGPGFGAAGDNLVDYFGPNVGAAAASKANAMMWMDASGSAYFGGQLSAGVLRNAVQTTTTQAIGTELVNGPFSTNGRVRTVTVSFTRRHRRTQTISGSTGFVAGAGQNTARVEVYRKIGNAGETLWQVLNAAGGVVINNERDGPDEADSSWGGAFTINDTSPSSDTVQYRAVITGFTEQTVTHTSGSFQGQTLTQSLSMISVEQ